MKNSSTKIEAWLNNELSEEEQQAFEAALAQDPDLEREVKTQILERETAALFFKKELQDDFVTWKAAKKAATASTPPALKKKTHLKVLRRTWAMAASFLLLITVGWIWWLNHPTHSDTQLTAQYLPADLPGDKSGQGALAPTFEEGLTAFAQGDYTTSLQQLANIEVADSNYMAAQYLLGHAHFQSKNYAAAITAFEQVVSATALPFYINRSKLKWNLLVTHIRAGQRGATFDALLQDLIDSGEVTYRRKAQQLKKELETGD